MKSMWGFWVLVFFVFLFGCTTINFTGSVGDGDKGVKGEVRQDNEVPVNTEASVVP